MKKMNRFDMPVDGLPRRQWSMESLMRAFRECQRSDPETAERIIQYACDCHHVPAKLAYGQFLSRGIHLKMPSGQRHQKAEAILLELVNRPGIAVPIVAEAAMELSKLYEYELQRPAGALAMYLYAKRLGKETDRSQLERLKTKLENTCLTQLCANGLDLFRLGQELLQLQAATEVAIWFLQEAIDRFRQKGGAKTPEEQLACAQACLLLADHLPSQDCSSAAEGSQRARLYAAARQGGYPEFLAHAGGRKKGLSQNDHLRQPFHYFA